MRIKNMGRIEEPPDMSKQEAPSSEKRPSKTVCVEDPTVTMVEPDTVTPLQFYDKAMAEAALIPEKRLMLAVLEDAIASFQRAYIESSPGGDEQASIDAWLESHDSTWPFAFEAICQALEMEPQYLRDGLRGWRDRATQDGSRGKGYRFPFRRVNGRRHSINMKRERNRTLKAVTS